MTRLLHALLASAAAPLLVAQVQLPSLPSLPAAAAAPVEQDWLVRPPGRKAGVFKAGDDIVLTNGLLRRTFRVAPNGATVDLIDLVSGRRLLRAVRPEARVVIDGRIFAVGGLTGQPDHAYLLDDWLAAMTTDPKAFQLVSVATGPTRERFPWKRQRYAADLPWPPPGVALDFTYAPPDDGPAGVQVVVHYELYDGLPLMAKWLTIRNGTQGPIRLQSFVSEILAVPEHRSRVEIPDGWTRPPLHVESDYAFHGMNYEAANETTRWVPDPQYKTQVNYRRLTPVLLESRPPLGPDIDIAPGKKFETFRTFLLPLEGDAERRGLARRRMMRTLAPWVTENPILMHVRHADRKSVRRAVDQCAEVGFEMVIMTFGSGFNMESTDPAYRARIKEEVDYAHSKGVELGGYSLLASRRISDEHDAINPDTGKPGGAIFGNSPCLESAWGQGYFTRVRSFIEETGLDLLEHDGSYPGDVCASEEHPGHRGLADSQWKQWRRITDFYKWCRGRGVYLNVPDWYFLNGSNKTGMGYRETNWSLPRARQILLARQNIFDGTWEKTPSMGWMFVPLVQYHGGGAAATLEPLSEHLDAYEAHLRQNFLSGVQACYRGPRLFDTSTTRETVKRWVDFYRKHRRLLDGDVIHVRRPDGRRLDAILHVDPGQAPCGLLVVHNPTGRELEEHLQVPLYYTGLVDVARIGLQEDEPMRLKLDREYRVRLPVKVPARSSRWWVITP